MEVSAKLAYEFHTILLSHTIALLFLVSFSMYITFRAKKTTLLYGYLSVVLLISLWLLSKIFKTVSPTIDLRWTFIVIQYFAIDYLGLFLLLFAHLYRYNKLPTGRTFLLWSIPPTLSFLILVTNPWHMTFYSYFDIYRDRFGLSFYLAQSVHYLYLLISCTHLSKGFLQQPGFYGNRRFGRIFSFFVLIPIAANVYYILFKMDVFPWIFPFPVFDFSPIAASLALMLFMIPALVYRFFDMYPISLSCLYDSVPQGILFRDRNNRFYGANHTLMHMMNTNRPPRTCKELVTFLAPNASEQEQPLLAFLQMPLSFIPNGDHLPANIFEYELSDKRILRIHRQCLSNQHLQYIYSDITNLLKTKQTLECQTEALKKANRDLDRMTENVKELAIARTKSQMAQDIHDILGHSLTVVIGTAELATHSSPEEATGKLLQMEELLTGSLNDIRNTFHGHDKKWTQNSLTRALWHLKNDQIDVSITTHGKLFEPGSVQTEAIYRLCQEAVTNSIRHGEAKNLYIILRYYPDAIEVYAIDNGKGCKDICHHLGLSGISSRLEEIGGTVLFFSDGEKGFTIHARLPIPSHY